jgi:thioredoxin 1
MIIMKRKSKFKTVSVCNILLLVSILIFVSCGGKNRQENLDQQTSNHDSVIDTSGNSVSNTQLNKSEEAIPNEILHLTDTDFDETIKNGIVLVEFWATWCGPCLMQAPILTAVNNEMAGKITIAKLDIDKCPVTTDRFSVTNIPTLVLFKNGKQVNQFVGLTQKVKLLRAINKELN